MVHLLQLMLYGRITASHRINHLRLLLLLLLLMQVHFLLLLADRHLLLITLIGVHRMVGGHAGRQNGHRDGYTMVGSEHMAHGWQLLVVQVGDVRNLTVYDVGSFLTGDDRRLCKSRGISLK